MKPLNSFFWLSLRSGVKIVCKSFMVLSAAILIINLGHLEYTGQPRQESKPAILFWGVFLISFTGSAFTGHAGADRESIYLTLFSLGFLSSTILQWAIVSIVSMSKSTFWLVCIQNRCPETLWMADLGYRANVINVPTPKPDQLDEPIMDRIFFVNIKTHELINFDTTHHKRNILYEPTYKTSSDLNSLSYENYDDYVENRKSNLPNSKQPEETLVVRVKKEGEEEKEESSGALLAIILVLLVFIFSYFIACATVICSYLAELYEVSKAEAEEEHYEHDPMEV